MLLSSTQKTLAAVMTCSLLAACGLDGDNNSRSHDSSGQVKNLILMIGDGMGAQQVGMLEEYARRSPANMAKVSNTTGLQQIANNGTVGLSLNAPMGDHPSLVVDSACSATQLATGQGSISEAVGLDDNGNAVETILEKAKKVGKATGLISDTRLTHATPAAFASHQPHRKYENEIAAQYIDHDNVDVLLGGGARHWIPATDFEALAAQLNAPSHVIKKSKRDDERNLVLEAKAKGYDLAFTKAQMLAATGTKLLGLFDDSAMNDGILNSACQNGDERAKCLDEPTLKDMTLKALDILSQDEDGFFLMVEGGQIDWAGHVNDAGWMLHELLKFDAAVAAVYEWVKDRDDTLVLVTADHETGSFGFSYSRSDLPEAKTLSGDGMQGQDYKPNFNFASLSILDKLYAQTGTFYDMMNAVDGDWDFSATTGAQWADAINAHVHEDFHVTAEQAHPITEREHNEFFVAGHKYLQAEVFPAIQDFKAFYVYGDELHGNLIGRTLATDQHVVWGTGTHTAAPVPVYAFGPREVTAQFSTMQHHVDLGQKMISALIAQ